MATVVSWNGSSYTVPATGEENWGGASKVDGLLIALATHGFQKSGGTFTLSAEVDFGGTAGLKSLYYKSRAASPSSVGVVRLGKSEILGWRNEAGDGDNTLTTDSSNRLVYNGSVVVAGTISVASGGTGLTSYTAGDMIYASGTTTLSKLGIGTANYVLRSDGSAPNWGLIANANIDASAGIAYSKLATVTASRVLVSDGSGFVSASSVTATTLSYLDATSSIQTQLNGKEATITTLAINKGGTGQSTAQAAIDALLPSQASASGKYLTSDGTNCSWGTPATGGSWGTITGTLSAQTDLQTALDAKVAHSSGASGRLAYWSGTATITSSANLTYDGQLISHTFSTAGSTAGLSVINGNNSNTASHAMLKAEVGGTSGGDPILHLDISGGTGWHAGVDNSDSDRFKIGTGSAVGTNTLFRIFTDGTASFWGPLITYNTGGTAGQLTEFYAGSSAANDGGLIMRGGNGSGAYIALYGSTHATSANVLDLWGGARIDVNGDFRIGTTGNLSSDKERLSVRRVPASGDAANSHATAFFQYLNNNTTAFSGSQTSVVADWRRTITDNVTDTGSGNYALGAGIVFSVASTKTYTLANTMSKVVITSTSLSGGGALAISRLYGIHVAADSIATGTTKVGAFIGTQSGASNNIGIGDSGAASPSAGNWGGYFSSSTYPWYIQADTRIGSTAVNALGTEKFTIADTRTGDASSHGGLSVLSTYSGNTPFSVTGNGILGGYIANNRTITSSTTDTCVRHAALMAQLTFTITAAQTLTNAEAQGLSVIAIPAFAAPSGAMAITHYHGIYLGAHSFATGTNKYGLRIGDHSGATNNYAIHTGTGAVSFGDYIELRANHDPGAPTDAVRLSAKASTDTGTPHTLHLRTEQAVEAIGSFTATNKLRIWHNNVEYHIQLDAV